MPRIPSRAILAVTAVALGTSMASAQTLTELWRIGGFSMPESVSYDPATDSFYATNINSPDMSANGEGYVTKIGPDGAVVEERFATGLNAPKGTFVRDGILYVAGIEEVVEVSLATGEVTTRHAVPGAYFVNDVAVAYDGTVYATETMQGAIYAINDGSAMQLVTDPALAGANGIIVDGDRLLVATLGDISQGFENLQPSNVKAVSITTGEVTNYGSDEPVGMLDGIEPVSGGVVVTDNGGGRLVMIADDGTVTDLGSTGVGSADFEYVPDLDMVVVPLLSTGEVVAYALSR